jgi:hypothetical protein
MIPNSLDQRQIQVVAFYAIPAVLLSLGGMTRKIIDGGPWRTKHFFLGLDLTIYFLATFLVNILDLTKNEHRPANGYVWTVNLVTVAIIFLLYQTAMHQDWEREDKTGQSHEPQPSPRSSAR